MGFSLSQQLVREWVIRKFSVECSAEQGNGVKYSAAQFREG
jgi:hypothetical protein